MRNQEPYTDAEIRAWDTGFETALSVMINKVADASLDASTLYQMGGRQDRDDYAVAVRAGVVIHKLTREWLQELKASDYPEVYDANRD